MDVANPSKRVATATKPKFRNGAHCPTCTCQCGNSNQGSRVQSPVTSRISHLLFQRRNGEIYGENVSKDKITLFKSLSPKPKNIVLHFASPPKTLTRSMIRELKMKKSGLAGKDKGEEDVQMTPTKHIRQKQSLFMSASTNPFDSIIKEKRLRSSGLKTFRSELENIRE